MLNELITFNISKKQNSPEEIEREFEMTRNNYLRDVAKVRRKYETKLRKLASAYQTTLV